MDLAKFRMVCPGRHISLKTEWHASWVDEEGQPTKGGGEEVWGLGLIFLETEMNDFNLLMFAYHLIPSVLMM